MAVTTAHSLAWAPCAYQLSTDTSAESQGTHLPEFHGAVVSVSPAQQWQQYAVSHPPACVLPSALPSSSSGGCEVLQLSHPTVAQLAGLHMRKRAADAHLDMHAAKHMRFTITAQPSTSGMHSGVHPETPSRHSIPSAAHFYPTTLPDPSHCPQPFDNDHQRFFSPSLTMRPPSVCCSVSCSVGDASVSTGPHAQYSPQSTVLTPSHLLTRPQSVASCSSFPTGPLHLADFPTPQLYPQPQIPPHFPLMLQPAHLAIHPYSAQQAVKVIPHAHHLSHINTQVAFYPAASTLRPHLTSTTIVNEPTSSCCSTSSCGGSSMVQWCLPAHGCQSYTSTPQTSVSSHCIVACPPSLSCTSYPHFPSTHHSQRLVYQAPSSAVTSAVRASTLIRVQPEAPRPVMPRAMAIPASPSWCSETNNAAALTEANAFMASVQLPGDVEFMRVGSGSNIHQLGVLTGVCAASICLAQSYYQRLVLVMPGLQLALYVLVSNNPKATANKRESQRCALPSTAAGPYSREQAEAISCSVKAACISLAAKMIEPRTGHHKRLQWLLARITSTTVTATEACALERRVLHHLDFRLGPYFDMPDSEC